MLELVLEQVLELVLEQVLELVLEQVLELVLVVEVGMALEQTLHIHLFLLS